MTDHDPGVVSESPPPPEPKRWSVEVHRNADGLLEVVEGSGVSEPISPNDLAEKFYHKLYVEGTLTQGWPTAKEEAERRAFVAELVALVSGVRGEPAPTREATLREAAKLVCPFCSSGKDGEVNEYGQHLTTRHGLPTNEPQYLPCEAPRIWEAIRSGSSPNQEPGA